MPSSDSGSPDIGGTVVDFEDTVPCERHIEENPIQTKMYSVRVAEPEHEIKDSNRRGEGFIAVWTYFVPPSRLGDLVQRVTESEDEALLNVSEARRY